MGRLNYLDNFPSYDIFTGNKIDHYFKKHSLLFPFGIDFIFRNTFFKLGGTLFSKTRLTGYFDQTWKGYLGVNLFPRSKIYLGPSLTYSSYYRKYLNNNTPVNVFDSWSFGTDFYFHKFHVNLNYSVYKNRYNKISVSNLRDINLCVGYGFNISSFKKKINRRRLSIFNVQNVDSNQFVNKFYFEINTGGGLNIQNIEDGFIKTGYSKSYQFYYSLNSNIFFRNNYFKIGTMVYSFSTLNNKCQYPISFFIGGNVFFKQKFYIGPFVEYATSIQKIPKHDIVYNYYTSYSYGIDSYFKKFHLKFYYSHYLKFPNQIVGATVIRKNRNLGIEIGYCFNLDSFRRKNRK